MSGVQESTSCPSPIPQLAPLRLTSLRQIACSEAVRAHDLAKRGEAQGGQPETWTRSAVSPTCEIEAAPQLFDLPQNLIHIAVNI